MGRTTVTPRFGSGRVRAIAWLLAALLLASIADVGSAWAGTASEATRSGVSDATPTTLAGAQRKHLLDLLDRFHAPPPMVDLLREAESVDTQTFVWPIAIRDLDGDGVDEVAEMRYTFSFNFGPAGGQGGPLLVEERGRTVMRVRAGDDGKVVWKRRWNDIVFFARGRLGPQASPGLITVRGLLSFFSTVESKELAIEAVRGTNGKRLWTHRYRSTAAGLLVDRAYNNVPLTIQTLQARPGRQTDLLVGIGTVSTSLLTTTVVARTEVLDGKDGTQTLHPTVDVGVNWTPYPMAVGDIDRDGFDDYVVTNNLGVDPGGDQELPSAGGTVYARRGSDGGGIWTTSGFTFYDFAWAIGLPDVVGGQRPDVAIESPADPDWHRIDMHLLDGEAGSRVWTKEGTELFSPGDVDEDGRDDVSLGRYSVDFDPPTVTYRRTTMRGSGASIWKRKVQWRFGGLCPNGLCLGGFGYGWSFAGDVHPDRIRERITYLHVRVEPNYDRTRSYLLDGESGRTILRSNGSLGPAGVAIDGRGHDLLHIAVKDDAIVGRALRGGNGKTLLRWTLTRANDLLPKGTWAFGEGLSVDRDRCGDVLQVVYLDRPDRSDTLYTVLDGGTARSRWSRWSGPEADRPRPAARSDANPTC